MPNYDYTPEQLRQMQQEAAARVREMQRRARARLEGTPEHRTETGQPAGQPVHTPGDIPRLSPPVPPPRGNHAQAPSGGLGGLLGQLGMPGMGELLGGQGDSDRTMLMTLLMLLSTQGNCSPGLIAALFWLMMG